MKGASVLSLSFSFTLYLSLDRNTFSITNHWQTYSTYVYKSSITHLHRHTDTQTHTHTQLTVVVSCCLSTFRLTFALTVSWSLVSWELIRWCPSWSFHLTAAIHVSRVMHKLYCGAALFSDDLVTNEAELIACCISFSFFVSFSLFRLDNLHINTCMEYPIADGNDYHKVVQLTLCRFSRTAHMSVVHGRRIIAWVREREDAKKNMRTKRKCVKIN